MAQEPIGAAAPEFSQEQIAGRVQELLGGLKAREERERTPGDPAQELATKLREKRLRKEVELVNVRKCLEALGDSVPEYVSPNPGPLEVEEDQFLLGSFHLENRSVQYVLDKLAQDYPEDPLTEIILRQDTGKWGEDAELQLRRLVKRPETPAEVEARVKAERTKFEKPYRDENSRLIKQYEKSITKLEASIRGLLRSECGLTGDSTELLRQTALAKLSDVEKLILGVQ